MDPARYDRIQHLFQTLADLPPAERQARLDHECAGEPGLRAEVEALLEQDRQQDCLLDRPVAGIAASMLSAPAAPRRVGRYELREVIGEGGMGVVYRAVRDEPGGEVALKILRDAWLSPSRRERFAQEQRILARINHPSIARLYDADTLPDGTPWFVMEYVDGLPLNEYCRQRQSTLEERLQLMRAVCEAVQFAHSNGIIHRDLKPSNILVRPDGAIRLLDFGISKFVPEGDAPLESTRTGLRLMTPAYAAPEQVRGEPAGLYTDVYALGVLLYELLAGRPPFDLSRSTPGEALGLIAESKAERPSVLARRTPGAVEAGAAAWKDLDVIVLKAMAREPAQRYVTAEALARDIGRFLRHEPIEATPASFRYRAGKFARRHWRALSATAAALLVLASVAAFFTLRLAAARNEALAEAARTQRIQRFMLNLFQGGDPEAGPPEGLRVADLLERGAQEARQLAAEPAIQAELYLTLGGLYQKQGNLKSAEELLTLARDRQRALGGEAHPGYGRALVALGQLRSAQARYDEAEALIRDGSGRLATTLPPAHPARTGALAALGEVLSARGRYADAIAVLERASRAAEGAPEAPGILYQLANAHFYAGHYEESRKLNQRLLPTFRKTLGEGHPSVADVLINLGAIQAEMGDFAGAAAHYRSAIPITQAWFGPSHPKTASNLTMLGRVLVRLEQAPEAMETLNRAIAIQEKHFGPRHPRVASALNEVGTLARSLGRPDEAEAHYRRAWAIWREVHGPAHYLNGIAVSNLAGVELDRGRLAQAEALMRDALARFEQATGPTHSNAGIARLKLGRVLLKRSKHREAERELRAGLAILEPQMAPNSPWLEAGRKDLASLPPISPTGGN